MNPNTLKMGINYNQICINDSSIQEINSQNQDYSVCSYPNLKSLNPNDYKIEEEPFVNNYYFSPHNLLEDKEFNREKGIEKTTKSITNEEKGIPIELNETNILFPKKNKDSNEENIETENNKVTKGLNEKTHLGRKRRYDYCNGEHNKYSDDNLRRKAKNLVLDYTMDFLNETIKNVYNGKIGEGISIKKLLPLNRSFKCDATIQHNKDILNKTLGDIFSGNISTRYTYYSPNHNCELIKRLLNEKDESKRLYFQKIFNLTFLDCLKSFSGNVTCEELKNLKKFREIKSKFTDETEYINQLEYYLAKFENIIKSKKSKNEIMQKTKKKDKKVKKGKEEKICKEIIIK